MPDAKKLGLIDNKTCSIDDERSGIRFVVPRVAAQAVGGLDLDDLVMDEVYLAAGPQVQVTLPSNNGLAGTFRCRSVTVLDAVPHEPGEHSVYEG